MDKRWEMRIDERMTGYPIRKVLREKLELTTKQISRMKFWDDGILVNGKKRRVTDTLYEGDLLSVVLEKGETENCLEAAHQAIDILYEDEDLILVKKEAGIVCHPGPGHYRDSLANQVSGYLAGKKEDGKIREVGRLDRDTSGIVVFAKNRITAAKLCAQREKGIFWKQYLAVVNGRMEQKKGEISQAIGPLEGTVMKMAVREDGKKAVTRYEVIREYQDSSVLLCTLLTGRTHQIRVHMAFLGHPILGDPFYGEIVCKKAKRLCLHAWKVNLIQPFTGEKIEKIWKLDQEEFGVQR